MPRKFWTSYSALVANYYTNQKVNNLLYNTSGIWTESTLINSPPPGVNLISMSIGAATIGNARCLRTNYSTNSVIPITCINGTWSSGASVGLTGGGSSTSVAVSFDGKHALISNDNSNTVSAVMFNEGTGLWVQNGYVILPETNLTSVGISPDGLRGTCVGKYYSIIAYTLFRDPITNVWNFDTSIGLTPGAGIRYFCISFDPTGTICLVGSNTDGVDGSALFWDGSSWTRSVIPFKFAASRWLADGKTVLAASGNISGRYILILNYDPITKIFSLRQTVSVAGGSADLWGISVPELGRQDIALATLFNTNQLVPFTNTMGVWSAGTPIDSPNFNAPLGSVIMPIL